LEGIRTDYPAVAEMLVNMSFTEQATAEMRTKTHSIKMSIQPEVVYGDFLACSKFDITAELEKLPKLPTLIIGASADQLMPIKLSQALADNIPGSKQVTIEAGHAVQIEKSHEFNKVLDTFIASIV
jgi:pimeloyl-ACP methyl ester carboxylesterase